MKPAWDKLMKKYAESKTALVADVDCTAGGKQLCEDHGVEGFPTIKWGDPSALEDYEGGRDFDDLMKFAEENLKPMCNLANLDLCDMDMKKKIADLQAMSEKDLQGQIEKIEGEMKEVSETFDKEVQKLQDTYEKLEKEKTEKLAAFKKSGLALMKSVLATKEDSDEL